MRGKWKAKKIAEMAKEALRTDGIKAVKGWLVGAGRDDAIPKVSAGGVDDDFLNTIEAANRTAVSMPSLDEKIRKMQARGQEGVGTVLSRKRASSPHPNSPNKTPRLTASVTPSPRA